jgi:hypothetical protein
MAAWQHGSMAAWQYGSMAAWQHGGIERSKGPHLSPSAQDARAPRGGAGLQGAIAIPLAWAAGGAAFAIPRIVGAVGTFGTVLLAAVPGSQGGGVHARAKSDGRRWQRLWAGTRYHSTSRHTVNVSLTGGTGKYIDYP